MHRTITKGSRRGNELAAAAAGLGADPAIEDAGGRGDCVAYSGCLWLHGMAGGADAELTVP